MLIGLLKATIDICNLCYILFLGELEERNAYDLQDPKDFCEDANCRHCDMKEADKHFGDIYYCITFSKYFKLD